MSQALKALRRRRGVRAADLAEALGMPERSYLHFESGRSRINIDRIHEIADILKADAWAILAAVELGSPSFAVRAADNKLMTIILVILGEFDARAGDQILQLDARTLMEVFEQTFDQLAAVAKDRDEAAQKCCGRRNPRMDDD